MLFRKKFDDKQPYFRGVALATILIGAAILTLGAMELAFNLWGNSDFVSPIGKIVGGAVVLSLGYIHLELELLRIK